MFITLNDYINNQNINFEIHDDKFILSFNDKMISSTGYSIIPKDTWFKQKYVILHDLKTNDEFKGRGYAKKLLKEIFNYVKNTLNIKIISLIVYKKNPIALKLYLNIGFEIFIEYDDCYSLVKKL